MGGDNVANPRRSLLPSKMFAERQEITFNEKKALKIKFSMLSAVGEATRTPDLSLRRRLHYPLCYTNLYEKAC